MPFRAEPHQEIVINGAAYEIAEHPAAPGMPYGQEGRQAVVYRIFLKGAPAAEKGGGASFAIKVFKPHFRLPSLVSLTERLGRYASVPGLGVCKRTVITPRNNADLLATHPDLIYSVVMPWLDGPTWMEVMLDGKGLPREMSLLLARSFADQLSYMEEYGTAHCDLSGPNLLIPALADPPSKDGPPVALVDVEQLYGPSLERPEALPGGSPGYAHRTAPDGLWSAAADRFAGALLLSEMLGVCDQRVLEASWGENYFDPGEVQKPGSARFDTLLKVLQENWGAAAGELLRRAWCSESLTECPTLGEWLMALQKQESVKPGTVQGAETADLPAASQTPEMQAAQPVQEAKAPVPEPPQPSESSLYASPVAAAQSPAMQSEPVAARPSLSCRSCGASLSEDMQFCSQCGTQVGSASQTVSQQAPVPAKTEPPQAVAPPRSSATPPPKPSEPSAAKPPEKPPEASPAEAPKKAVLPVGSKIAIAAALLLILALVAKLLICDYSAYSYTETARKLLSDGKSDEALELLNKAIALKPSAYGYSLRAKAYCRRGDYQNALADYRRSDFYGDEFDRGIVYYRTGDYDKAIDDFNKAIQDDDGAVYGHSYGKKAEDNPERYLFRGKAYCEKGDFASALADFKMESPRRSMVNYIDYLGTDYDAGDFVFTQKVESYDKAISLYPENAAGYYGRGLAYYEHGDYDKALSDLRKAESMGYNVNWSIFTLLKK
jgi:hypothetical protein